MKSLLKTVRLLCVHNGENAPTATDPQRQYKPADKELLAETKRACISYDFDMLTTVWKYEVRELEIPAWLKVDSFCRDMVAWRWFWATHKDAITLPRQWQERLSRMDFQSAYALVKLLMSNPRADFRKSIKAQAVAWLDAKENQYDSPLSPNQWRAIKDQWTCRDADAISRELYQHRHVGVDVTSKITKRTIELAA